MSKMSAARKARKGLIESPIKIERRNLTPLELKEYIGMETLVGGEMWKAIQIAANTAIVPNGKELAEQSIALVKVLTQAKENWVNQVLIKCGIAPGVSVNIHTETGQIVEATPSEKKIEKNQERVMNKVMKNVEDTLTTKPEQGEPTSPPTEKLPDEDGSVEAPPVETEVDKEEKE